MRSASTNITNIKNALKAKGIAIDPVYVYHCYFSCGVVIKDLLTEQKVAFSCDRDGTTTN